jgi:hypothetical protein
MRWTPPLGAKATFTSLTHSAHSELTPINNSIISCYINEIPSYIKVEMERLYQNAFSSTAAEHVNNSNTSTYVVSLAGRPTTIFLFQLKKEQVRVLNTAIKIKPDEIHQFTNYIFGQYKSVTSIIFRSIQTDRLNLSLPYQQFNSSEDIVLTLPDTAKTYSENLGKNMRRNIRRYSENLLHRFPSYQFQVYEKEQINEQHMRDIIDLNAVRMQGKNKLSMIDDKHTNWVIQMAKTYGCIGVATIDARVCAGVICSRVGDNFFMDIIAHDPAYNEFSLGTLCCYQMICEAITRGGKEYHFLWGQGDYKYWFLGVQKDLDDLTVYRSWMHCFLNPGLMLHNEFTSYIRKAKIHFEKNTGVKKLLFRWIAKFIRRLNSRNG